MRILILTADYPSETHTGFAFVHARAKIYLKKKDEVLVFIPDKKRNLRAFEGVPVESGSPLSFFEASRRFIPDVIAVHAPHYLTARRYLEHLNVPFAVWFHGSEGLFRYVYFRPSDLKAKAGLISDVLKFALLRRLLMKASGAVYVSDWLRRKIERNIVYRHPLTRVIPNPVDTELFYFKQKTRVRRGISVRGFDWKYGLETAILAFRHLAIYSLTLSGSGPMEKDLRRLAGPNICFLTTPVNHGDLPAFYDNYGFFVAPSRLEAQGVAMCEAMSCGLPVVASNVGGIPEFVHDGVSGFLVPPDKPIELAQAVRRLTSDQKSYKEFGRNARLAMEKVTSHERVYAAEIALLKQVCGKS